MNPIVRSAAIWFAESFPATVLEAFLEKIVGLFHHFETLDGRAPEISLSDTAASPRRPAAVRLADRGAASMSAPADGGDESPGLEAGRPEDDDGAEPARTRDVSVQTDSEEARDGEAFDLIDLSEDLPPFAADGRTACRGGPSRCLLSDLPSEGWCGADAEGDDPERSARGTRFDEDGADADGRTRPFECRETDRPGQADSREEPPPGGRVGCALAEDGRRRDGEPRVRFGLGGDRVFLYDPGRSVRENFEAFAGDARDPRPRRDDPFRGPFRFPGHEGERCPAAKSNPEEAEGRRRRDWPSSPVFEEVPLDEADCPSDQWEDLAEDKSRFLRRRVQGDGEAMPKSPRQRKIAAAFKDQATSVIRRVTLKMNHTNPRGFFRELRDRGKAEGRRTSRKLF